MTNNNAPSFKYKASLIGNTENDGTKNGVKIAVPLKYLSNFWRSLEMPLINCKVELSLKWIENCMLSTATTAAFKITDAKLYVPIVTLSSEDNAKLSKLLSERFKRSIYWNDYKVIPNKIVEIAVNNEEKYMGELIQIGKELKRLFALAYNNTAGNNQVSLDSHKKYFLFCKKYFLKQKITISKLMVEISMIKHLMTQLNNMITGQGDDYTTGCLLDFSYFHKNYRIIPADLSKQKPLDAD